MGTPLAAVGETMTAESASSGHRKTWTKMPQKNTEKHGLTLTWHGISDEGVVAVRQRDEGDAGDWYRYRDYEVLASRHDLFTGVATFGSISPDPLLTATECRVTARH